MTESSFEREALALFEAMFEIASADRPRWIAAQTEGRSELRARLLAMHEAETRLVMLQTGGAIKGLEEEEDESPPERIGAYRILERIGRGGMGAVYRGTRDAGDFAHQAAIKVIKPGLLSSALVERFERERATLATLSHPNIAQLYDGGQTADNSPFIIMELVEGEPLLDWAQNSAAPLALRLAVFRQACAGVAFAHANLVVHRDLAPSNVLVTGSNIAKLIDFGIARPADAAGDEAEVSRPNSLASLTLTPGFSAPERRTSGAVTTAADIYSLGKLLAMLLPADAGDELTAIAARASAADPADRYPTVEALDADIAAFLEHRPVEAMPRTRRYLLHKFVARNRRLVLLSGAAGALLLAAFGVTAWQWYRAEEARAAEAQRFEEVRSLARYLLFDLNDRLAQVPGNVGARASLAAEAQSYLDILAASRNAPADLRLEIAQGLVRLGQIQGVPTSPNLGLTDEAQANLARAIAFLDTLPPSPARSIERARADVFAGLVMLHGDFAQTDAEARLDRAIAALEAVSVTARGASWHQTMRNARLAMLEFNDVGEQRDRFPALIAAMVADRANWPAAMRNGDLVQRDDAVHRYYEALRLSYEGGENVAELFLANERRFDALLAESPFDSGLLYRSVWNAFDGFATASQEGHSQSARLIEKTNDLVTRLVAIDPRDDSVRALVPHVREGLAQNLRDQERYGEAIAMQQGVVAGHRAAMGSERETRALGNTAFSLGILGIIARDAGNRALACASWREGAELFTIAEARGEILGFQQAMLDGMRLKRAPCENGGPIDTPLRAPE